MKKIRILSLCLAVVLLMGALALFASCGTTPEVGNITLSKETVDLDMTGYTVLFGESQGDSSFTNTVRDQFNLFVSRLSEATGANFKAKQANRTDPDPEAKEILLGLTDREETVAALQGIEGEGFVIQVLENKIVIVGTDNLYTVMAMDHFIKNYATGVKKDKTLSVNKTVWAYGMESVVLADSAYKKQESPEIYTYVYKDGLGMVPDPYSNLQTDVTVPSYTELPTSIAKELSERMVNIAKVAIRYFPVGTDATTNEREVLIGITSREETRAALSQISESQFVVSVIGERVVVSAWSNKALTNAAAAYREIIAEATRTDEEGNVRVLLPRGFRLIGEIEHNWTTDFPKPDAEGVELYNAMDNNDGSLQYLYRGEGVNQISFEAYCRELKEAGYTELQSTYAEGSIFKFFENKDADIALYVAYNAYAHKDDYEEYDNTIIKQIDNKVIEPYDFEASIRIISSAIATSYFPEEKLLTLSDYTYRTQSAITSMPLYSNAVGHCYIVTLEDGSFIVYDGGNVNSGSREQDRIWDLLNELHYQVWGKEPTKEEPIRIAAWILSHVHVDHYRAFSYMLKEYGSTGKIKMDYMIANVPSADSYADGLGEVSTAMTPAIIKSLQSAVPGGFKLIKPHTGMKFYIGNVEFETITTWEDLNPVRWSNSNDSNTVLRMTLLSQKNATQTTMMWLGDANRLQSRFMCATFGTYLKSDMSTVAHHGNAGCEIELYEMIDPETLFWTHHTGSVQSYLNPENKRWINEVDQYFAYKLESVKRIFANGPQQFYASGDTSSEAYKVAKGEVPCPNGYMHLVFDGATPDFDNVQELHFTFVKEGGKWVSVDSWTTALAHTDISGGAKAFHTNKNGEMTFCSNYMVKCDTACPTGQHTH